MLSDSENSRNILFTYFSPDINDNLSPFAGPFIAENANKILISKSRRKVAATKSLKRLTHFYSTVRVLGLGTSKNVSGVSNSSLQQPCDGSFLSILFAFSAIKGPANGLKLLCYNLTF